ncbi:hypothetical protein E1264_32835 [Actinomadura sp. KC216]|uniref:hypothetical protein n=1 Tax=Actinomadura sp. KC216 TaxID=2530370 RepID=UPI00104C38E7|nr:hypothetical protein [Actinomadura sp. KC216]TDB81360.1 hypothetical protein E1264_32835 [Actinomadura sp. KC216]
MTCYDTFTQAVTDATNGKITNAPRDAATAVASKTFNDRINAVAQVKGRSAAGAAATVIEISFEHRDAGGSSLTWETSSGCNDSGGVEWQVGNVSGWWNDRISSFRTYARCQGKHWEHSNFRGASTGFWNSTSYIGNAMNDRTSSIQWG